MLQNIKSEISAAYEGYPLDFLFNFGWVVAIGVMMAGALFATKKWPAQQVNQAADDDDEEVAN